MHLTVPRTEQAIHASIIKLENKQTKWLCSSFRRSLLSVVVIPDMSGPTATTTERNHYCQSNGEKNGEQPTEHVLSSKQECAHTMQDRSDFTV